MTCGAGVHAGGQCVSMSALARTRRRRLGARMSVRTQAHHPLPPAAALKRSECVCVCVCVCVRVCVCVCVGVRVAGEAFAHAWVRACVRACVRVRVCQLDIYDSHVTSTCTFVYIRMIYVYVCMCT